MNELTMLLLSMFNKTFFFHQVEIQNHNVSEPGKVGTYPWSTSVTRCWYNVGICVIGWLIEWPTEYS